MERRNARRRRAKVGTIALSFILMLMVSTSAFAGSNYWSTVATKTGYESVFTDTFNCASAAPSSVTLQTTSETFITISGSTEFNFANWVKASLSGSIGSKWGKTYTITIAPKLHTTHVLKSACNVLYTKYAYTPTNGTTRYSYSSDKIGTEQWYDETPYNGTTNQHFSGGTSGGGGGGGGGGAW